MLAFAEYEAGVGPCGYHHAETTEKDEFFFEIVDEKHCPVCAELDRHERIRSKRDSAWAKQQSRGDDGPPAEVPWPGDGRVTFVRRIPKEAAQERMAKAAEKKAARPGAARRGSPRRPRRAAPAADS